jgi:HsdM N-terminal domain
MGESQQWAPPLSRKFSKGRGGKLADAATLRGQRSHTTAYGRSRHPHHRLIAQLENHGRLRVQTGILVAQQALMQATSVLKGFQTMPLSKQQLGSLLWGIADTGLRGKVEDYKAYILSLLFFKRLSDNYTWETERRIAQFREQYDAEPNAKQLARLHEEGHAFVIPAKCFWTDVRDAPLDEKNERLHEAVNAIAERNPSLKGIINSVRWNEPAPDGSGNKRLDPEVVAAAINYLDPIPLDNSNASADVLGDAYEYLIKRFADENKGGHHRRPVLYPSGGPRHHHPHHPARGRFNASRSHLWLGRFSDRWC